MLLHQIIKSLEKAPQTRLEAIHKYSTLMVQIAHWSVSELPEKDQRLAFKELYAMHQMKLATEVKAVGWLC